MRTPPIKLVPVYVGAPAPEMILFNLLRERPAEANISHQEMPTWEEHVAFIKSGPYYRWYIIHKWGGRPGLEPVGSCYITDRNEIGIAILKAHQRRGYAREALMMLTTLDPPLPAIPGIRAARFFANIAPGNTASIALFRGLGATHISNTYQF